MTNNILWSKKKSLIWSCKQGKLEIMLKYIQGVTQRHLLDKSFKARTDISRIRNILAW